MGRERRHATDEVVEQLRLVLRGLHVAAAPSWLELGLTLGQMRCLFAINAGGTLTVSALAERLGVGLPAASTVSDQLVRLEYVDRTADPDDRRRALLCVTAKGDDAITGVREGHHQVLGSWLEGLSDDELEQLRAGMSPLVRSVTSLAGSATPADPGADTRVEGSSPLS
jgi:DNA-binding MarR family transcriptional regulator